MPSRLATPFGHYARHSRLRAGLSRAELGAIVGLTPQHIQRVEQGQIDPPLGPQLDQWAEALVVTPEEFWERATGPARRE